MNLHELVQLPHGEATKRIKEAGKWDEWAGKEECKWEVKYTVTYTYDDEDTVLARSEQEAFNKVCENKDLLDSYSFVSAKKVG